MGAWSHEPFGNDDAGDWACELEEAEYLSYVEAELDAKRALHRVRGGQSELNELWHEGDASEWEASLRLLDAAVSA